MTLYREMRDDGADSRSELVRVERENERAIVTLADAANLNCLSPALNLQLQERLGELAHDPGVRAVVITGADPAFSAGGDLRMISDGNSAIRSPGADADTTDAWRWIRAQFGGVVRTLAGSDTFFIAAVNGPAAGVGLAFAWACDLVIASERAVLVPAFGRLGMVPEVGTSWHLTRRLGYHGAMSYFLSGRHINADEARELGLVEEVCAHERLLDAADEWCDRALAMPAHALQMSKSLLRAAADADWEGSLRLEEFAEANTFSTAGLGEAARGILNRRGEESGAGERRPRESP